MQRKKIYSTWRDNDIRFLVPGISAYLENPDAIDFKGLKRHLDNFLFEQKTRIEQAINGEAALRFKAYKDPEALAAFLEEIEDAYAQVSRVQTFCSIAPEHYASHWKAMSKAIGDAETTVGQINVLIDNSAIIQALSKKDLTKMLAEYPRLRPFEAYLHERKLASPIAEKMDELDGLVLLQSQEAFQKIVTPSLPDKKRQTACAKLVNTAMDFHRREAEAWGFKSPLGKFAKEIQLSVAEIHKLLKPLRNAGPQLCEAFDHAAELVEKLGLEKSGVTYSWQEAREIVCRAYAPLGPEIGAIVARAFDEGWVAARGGKTNGSNTQASGSSKLRRTHPFVSCDFSGSAADVVILGHEMGHLLQYYLSNSAHKALTYLPPDLSRETFSHLGEALVEKEMLERKGKSARQMAFLEFELIRKELNALSFVIDTDFEIAMHTALKGGHALSYGAMNAIYHKAFKAFAGTLDTPLCAHDLINQTETLLSGLPTIDPLNSINYPICKAISQALLGQFLKEPETFRANCTEAMKAGSTRNIKEIWHLLLGEKADMPKLVKEEMKSLQDRLAALTQQLETLPPLEKRPCVGPMTEALARRDATAKPAYLRAS